jgi:outer membrane protein OmpA-like peptidoglycan-associated protein
MTFRNIILITVITLAAALPAAAQTKDVAGSKDSALLTRMPNFYISDFKDVQFDAHEFVVAKGNSTANQHVEGHLMYWRYDIIPGTTTLPSWLQIFRNHENAVQKLGGKTMYNSGPGNNYDSTFLISKNGTDTWIELHPRGRSAGSGMYELLIVEVQKMQQDVVANADALKSGLADSGHVEVPGIFFDFAKSDVKPESQPAIQQVVKMLQASPALKVWVVGHTDNVGTAEANVALSNARAASVVKALVAAGIDARRLTPHGDGPFAPVAANTTDDGRARNRRVELVAQP